MNKKELIVIMKTFNELIVKHDLVIAYEVHSLNRPLLTYMDPRLSNDKSEWIRRKRNVCLQFALSSLEVASKNNHDFESFSLKYGYDSKEMTLTAGAVPIIKDGILQGVITVTGLTPQEDHDLALEVLSNL